MAYCRWINDCDIYLVDSGDCISCLGCELEENTDFFFRSDVIAHLMHHEYKGDLFPEYLIEWIEHEMRELGDLINPDYEKILV